MFLNNKGYPKIMEKIPEDVLGILACPACRSSLEKDGEKLKCRKCNHDYEIKGGIPVLLPPGAN
jgi:uncharacterized protein YbaR (Trm112 family)